MKKDFSIETNRLLLRPFTLEDAEEYFKMTRDDIIKHYNPGSCPDTLEETIRYIESTYSQADFVRDYYLLIEEKETKKLVGSIMLTQNFFMKEFEAAYFIKSSYRRKGFMKEALEAFLKAITPLPKDILFKIEHDNKASLSLIQQIESITKIAETDAVVYALQAGI